MKKTPFLGLFIVLIFAVAIRLYPTLVSGMPFSTDSWPLIRNTELILQNTPIPIDSGIFDAYNNYWPGNQLFGAALSQITRLPVITALSIGIPIASAFTILIFFFLTKKITGNNKIALGASLMLAVACSYTLYTAGVTKEAFASPIYMTLILLFLQKHNLKIALLFTATSLALALTHHFTAFFATVILLGISVSLYVKKRDLNQVANSNKSNFILAAAQVTITALYMVFFSSSSFNSIVNLTNVLTVSAYEIIAVALLVYLVYASKRFTLKKTLLQFFAGNLLAVGIMFIILNYCTLPGAHLLYALPLLIGLPVVVYGLNELYQRKSTLMVPLFWLISVLAFTGFAVFANPPDGSGLTWRSMNFILPPLMILIAVGAYKLYTAPKRTDIRRWSKIISVLAILSIVSINAYGIYATVSEHDSSLGYFWLYHPSDYKAASWIAANVENQTTAGDARVAYLLQEYFNASVSTTQGLRYLDSDGPAPEILYIYNQMGETGKGYVLAGVPLSLPSNWFDKLSNYNCIYANNEVTIYARR